MKFRALLFVALVALPSVSSNAAHVPLGPLVKKVVLPNRTVDVLIESPPEEGPHPLLVIAPGRTDGHLHGIYPVVAEAARKLGFVTLRFNWGYRNPSVPSEKGKTPTPNSSGPTADLKQEAEDLSTVLTSFTRGRVNKTLEIDANKVVLLVDGLAARVAMMPDAEVLKSNVNALLLLNPECPADSGFTQLYSALATIKKPVHLIFPRPGNGCDPAAVYDLAKSADPSFSLYSFPGNAVLGDEKSPATSASIATLTEALGRLGWSRKKTP